MTQCHSETDLCVGMPCYRLEFNPPTQKQHSPALHLAEKERIERNKIKKGLEVMRNIDEEPITYI